jgi:hypothetical protein
MGNGEPLVCGQRSTYRRGCRCLRCRAANANYERVRRAAETELRALVSATDAAAYLLSLKARGVGYRQAAKLSGLSLTEIREVRAGARQWILPETEAAILTIRPVLALGQHVSAWPTWRLIHSLESEGFTLGSLARRLGLQSGQLQIDHHRVTVKNALMVRHFHARVTAEGPEVSA